MFRPKRTNSKYCSRPCQWINNGGKNKKPVSWWKNQRGYIEGRIWLPDGAQIRVKQHRFIMEGILNRTLQPDEDVHHIDGNKLNNNPSNLRLVSHGEHSTFHNTNRKHRRGYTMNLTENERTARAIRAIAIDLSRMGHAAIAKATENKEGELN